MEEKVFEQKTSSIGEVFPDFFEGMSKKQIQALEAAYMAMSGYVWLLYEKEDGWYIAVKPLENLEKVLWTKVRVVGWPCEEPITLENMFIDFKDTNFDEKTKYEYLYYTERNRDYLLSAFLGKFEPEDSEEYKDYERWVIQE